MAAPLFLPSHSVPEGWARSYLVSQLAFARFVAADLAALALARTALVALVAAAFAWLRAVRVCSIACFVGADRLILADRVRPRPTRSS